MASSEPTVNKYRSVFISDVHLGTQACQADMLLKFLKTFECEKLYLVGDIIDGWEMHKKMYWPQSHNDVIQKILRKGRKGSEIYYIPGNHDEFLRSFGLQLFGNINLVPDTVHISPTGKTYLVIHGDQFDVVVKNAKWLAHVGSWAYDVAISLNIIINKARQLFGMPYWSLSAWAKYKVKSAVNFIGNYEESLSNFAKSKNVDGIICGHIHHANMTEMNGIKYINCGDWVESCTAIVEHYNGTLELVRFANESK
jgi:UDP-2,3-diacylglucosamine pyrophosphatase LpxH